MCIRDRDRVEESNAKMMNLSKEEYDRFEKLGKEILKGLQQAVSGHENPQGEMGRRLAEMHREWLEFTWQRDVYRRQPAVWWVSCLPNSLRRTRIRC